MSKQQFDPQVFICHASEDRKQAKEVYQRLSQEGFRPWMDKIDLLPGQNWREEIPKALRASRFIIILFSSNSVSKKGFVQREFKLALDTLKDVPPGQLFIIPVRLDKCEVPREFRDIQYCDLFEKNGMELVLKTIRSQEEDVLQLNPVGISRTEDRRIPKTADKRKRGAADSVRKGSHTVTKSVAFVALLLAVVALSYHGIGQFSASGSESTPEIISRDTVSVPVRQPPNSVEKKLARLQLRALGVDNTIQMSRISEGNLWQGTLRIRLISPAEDNLALYENGRFFARIDNRKFDLKTSMLKYYLEAKISFSERNMDAMQVEFGDRLQEFDTSESYRVPFEYQTSSIPSPNGPKSAVVELSSSNSIYASAEGLIFKMENVTGRRTYNRLSVFKDSKTLFLSAVRSGVVLDTVENGYRTQVSIISSDAINPKVQLTYTYKKEH